MEEPRKRLIEAAEACDAEMFDDAADRVRAEMEVRLPAHPKAFVSRLKATIEDKDKDGAGKLVDRLVDLLRGGENPYSIGEAADVLLQVRNAKDFARLARLADAFLGAGLRTAVAYRQYAQALIDSGCYEAAIPLLEGAVGLAAAEGIQKEQSDIQGLIGRVYKDRYAAGRNQDDLERSIRAYLKIYGDPAFADNADALVYNGINVVALVHRARRDELELADVPDADAIAKHLIDIVRARVKANAASKWDYATAMEASVALDRPEDAIEWCVEYTKREARGEAEGHGVGGAFPYSSTLRQMENIWQLDESDPGQARILHFLRSAVLREEGGRIEIRNLARTLQSAASLKGDKQFEKVLGPTCYQLFEWYRTGLERARGVAKISDRFRQASGTGFMIDGGAVRKEWAGQSLLVTNSHVISPDRSEQRDREVPSLKPADALITFEASPAAGEFRVKSLRYNSHRDKLDCTIVELDRKPPEEVTRHPVAEQPPDVDEKTPPRVYVIGHPRGGGLSFSLQDNLMLKVNPPKVHYRAPTDPGSSGSPVFDEQWDLFAVHHAGGSEMDNLGGEGTHAANEGILLESIRDAVDRKVDAEEA